MEDISTVGMDIGKHLFQIHGENKKGQVVLKQKTSRSGMMEVFEKLPKGVLVGIESCSGAHFHARELRSLGHEVKLMPPQYVKKYVKTNKNDAADAEACCEGVTRPNMRFVEVKTEQQQSYAQLLCVRDRLVRNRTMVVNQLHGFLLEFGVCVKKGVDKVIGDVIKALETYESRLPMLTRQLCRELVDELNALNKLIDEKDKAIEAIAKNHEVCKNLLTIPGIGAVTALAMLTVVGDVTKFKTGRDFSAFLGLVPRQSSSASKERLGGISKRGNPFVRKLLVQGAQALSAHAAKSTRPSAEWFVNLKKRRGHCKAIVAMANKNARIVWAILTRGEVYQADHKPNWNRKRKEGHAAATPVRGDNNRRPITIH